MCVFVVFSSNQTKEKNTPGFVAFELALGLLLLSAQSALFGFALLFEQEGGAALGHLVLRFLFVLEKKCCPINLVGLWIVPDSSG